MLATTDSINFMLGHIQRYIDWIFPPSTDALCVRDLSTEMLVRNTNIQTKAGITTLQSYANSQIRALIHEAKFHHNQRALEILSQILTGYFTTLTKHTIILPIPLSKERLRERGYNQVEVIARMATRDVSHVSLRTDILYRNRHTVAQSGLERAQRLTNVADCFSLQNPGIDLSTHHILIIDDVTTTGATLTTAQSAVQSARPTTISLLAIAH